MHKLSIEQIIKKIERGECFEATAEDNSFSIYISEYVPYICAAIHNGENFRRDLRNNCLLSKYDRWFEEDPLTADFVSSLPIRIVGNDSRYEYDLNRDLDNCVYETAWGKDIWRNPLTEEQKKISKNKHKNFYRVVDALVSKIEKKFKACIAYDIHSYNYKRITKVEPPMFNVGTVNVNRKFKKYIQDWLLKLSKIESDYFVNETEENKVFEGHGNFLKHISKKFKNTLVLATEVRKSYCDELSGDIFPEVVEELKNGFREAILENAKLFAREKTSFDFKSKDDLLTSMIEPLARVVDIQIYRLVKNFDLLEFVNPKNLEAEKKKFFSSKFKKNPFFKYKPLDVDVTEFKRALFELPVNSVNDITLKSLFKSVINAYADQVEMLSFRGDQKFKYMSLKYFGEPSKDDLELAEYLIKSPDEVIEERMMNTQEALKAINAEIKYYKFNGKVDVVRNIPSHAVFIPSKKLLRIKKDVTFKEGYLKALCHHEIGVHMLTTENAQKQPLRIFEVGLPINTYTQEGLAIASEYKAGLLTIDRLKELALRTIAVNHMLKNDDFKETFLHLVEKYSVDEEKAFYICARVYRGGGFTKDYLYLKGFRTIKMLLDEGKDISPLLIGKTSIEFYDQIDELISRGILKSPEIITRSFNEEVEKSPVIEYLLKSFIQD